MFSRDTPKRRTIERDLSSWDLCVLRNTVIPSATNLCVQEGRYTTEIKRKLRRHTGRWHHVIHLTLEQNDAGNGDSVFSYPATSRTVFHIELLTCALRDGGRVTHDTRRQVDSNIMRFTPSRYTVNWPIEIRVKTERA